MFQLNDEINENTISDETIDSDNSEIAPNSEATEITEDKDTVSTTIEATEEEPAIQETSESTDIPQPALTLNEMKRIIEALLFVSDKPITIQKIKSLLETPDVKTIREIIHELKDEYDATEKSFYIIEIAGGYQIYTRDKYAPWIKKLIQSRTEKKLSTSLIETLAIIAYKQPIPRLEIEAIRGVGVSHSIKLLLEKKLIQIVGKKEGIGKSLLYGTTKDFLIYFGLKSLEGLPQLNELKEFMKTDTQTSNPNSLFSDTEETVASNEETISSNEETKTSDE